jgi:uncharacterized protein (DUF2267 family)
LPAPGTVERLVDYDGLITEIQRAGTFRDRAHANDAAAAVLSVLGEHLVGGAPRNLAAQLPPELADALPPEGGGERVGIYEFDDRVCRRETYQCSLEEAHAHAIAVMTVVLRSVSPGEAAKIAAELPREFGDLVPLPEERPEA